MDEHQGVRSTQEHHFTNKIVKVFLDSNLSLILILLATIPGFAALWLTPREEDPQIVVPLADIYVNFPGHSAGEVEQLIATPLEKSALRSRDRAARIASEFVRVRRPRRGEMSGSAPVSRMVCRSRAVPSAPAANTTWGALKMRAPSLRRRPFAPVGTVSTE